MHRPHLLLVIPACTLALASGPGRLELRTQPGPAVRAETILAGETCATAIDVGTVPPDHFESGLVIYGSSQTWRSFTLTTPRLVRAALVPNPPAECYCFLALHGDCASPLAGAWPGADTCLPPGTFHLALWNPSGPAISADFSLEDHGPCFPSGGLLARPVRVEDVDGDHDAYPDTGETVEVFLEISNKSPIDLTSVAGVAASSDPRVECVASTVIPVGSLGAHSSVVATQPFVFRVSPSADRAAAGRTVDDDYAASFTLTLSADQVPTPVVETLRLDLDLNATTPVIATSTFVEGFESGLSSFEPQNLDENRATNLASTGFRCQYSTPRIFCGSECCDPDVACECYLGFASGQSPVNDWHVHTTVAPDGGRARLGGASLHYGKHTAGSPGLDTYGLSQLDAVRTTASIPLAARICANDPAQDKRACNAAADCLAVGGGPCVGASPELSFDHQVSTVDSRHTNTPLGEAIDRAVVQVQRSPSTIWENVKPFENRYDVQGTDAFSNCMFDPIDDGSNEDSFFDPADPERRFGPSSTCKPELVFSALGDTDEPFDAQRIGRASDGPGLAGSLGQGTWVRSRFDLSRYRGGSIKLRFLFTSLKATGSSDYVDYNEFFAWAPSSSDDGWYIDDVQVTQTVGASTPTLFQDGAPPPAGDPDGDGAATCSDCRPLDPSVWASPGEALGLLLSGSSPTMLAWTPPPAPGASSISYDVLRSDGPGSFAAAICVVTGSTGTFAQDPDLPPLSGSLHAYLVRAENACGENLGAGSSGAPRVGASCP